MPVGAEGPPPAAGIAAHSRGRDERSLRQSYSVASDTRTTRYLDWLDELVRKSVHLASLSVDKHKGILS